MYAAHIDEICFLQRKKFVVLQNPPKVYIKVVLETLSVPVFL